MSLLFIWFAQTMEGRSPMFVRINGLDIGEKKLKAHLKDLQQGNSAKRSIEDVGSIKRIRSFFKKNRIFL